MGTHRRAAGFVATARSATLAAQVALALESVALTEDLLERESERRFRRLVQNSTDVIIVLEPNLTIRFATPSAKTTLGYESEALVGTNLVALLRPGVSADVVDLVAGLAGGTEVHDLELRCADGGWCAVESAWNDLSHDPEVNGTRRHRPRRHGATRAGKQLTHQAFHDPLTGLANRALFHRPGHPCARPLAIAATSDLAVLFVDLDGFKTVNDSLGHAAGDELLVRRGAAPAWRVRTGDTVARLGGDEFAILLEDSDRLDELGEHADADRAQRSRRRSSRPARASCLPRSAGSTLNRRATGPTSCIRNADIAMYLAKQTARRCVDVFEPAHAPRGPRAARARRGSAARRSIATSSSSTTSPSSLSQRAGSRRVRGAGALAASRARPARARQVRAARRGDRPHRPNRAMACSTEACLAGRRLAARLPEPIDSASASTSPGASCADPASSPRRPRDPRRPACAPAASCSRSPKRPHGRRRGRHRRLERLRSSGSASRSTISARVSPRSATSIGSRSTCSRSRSRSSIASGAARSGD